MWLSREQALPRAATVDVDGQGDPRAAQAARAQIIHASARLHSHAHLPGAPTLVGPRQGAHGTNTQPYLRQVRGPSRANIQRSSATTLFKTNIERAGTPRATLSTSNGP